MTPLPDASPHPIIVFELMVVIRDAELDADEVITVNVGISVTAPLVDAVAD
jgi:hypothetical protein